MAKWLIETRRGVECDCAKLGPGHFLYLSNNSGAKSNIRCPDDAVVIPTVTRHFILRQDGAETGKLTI